MALGNDTSLGYLKLACGTHQLYAGRSGNVAALTDGGRDTQRTCVGKGKLYLVLRSFGTEHAYGKAALGTDKRYFGV